MISNSNECTKCNELTTKNESIANEAVQERTRRFLAEANVDSKIQQQKKYIDELKKAKAELREIKVEKEKQSVNASIKMKELEKLVKELTEENIEIKNENKVFRKLYEEEKTKARTNEVGNEKVKIAKKKKETEQANLKIAATSESSANENRRQVKNKFDCDQCDFKTTLLNNLKKHKMVAMGHKITETTDIAKNRSIVNCEQCDMRFANKTALLTHIKELHNARTEINCTLCDFVAVNKEILDKHMKIAMGHKIQKECFQFRNGSCLRGRFCKFLHQQNSRNANDMMDENIRQNNNWNRNNTGYSNLQ